jgi:hypothetical protein
MPRKNVNAKIRMVKAICPEPEVPPKALRQEQVSLLPNLG